jgi:hypothetical protein
MWGRGCTCRGWGAVQYTHVDQGIVTSDQGIATSDQGIVTGAVPESVSYQHY